MTSPDELLKEPVLEIVPGPFPEYHYAVVQSQLLLLAGISVTIDIDRFLQDIDQCDAVGPLVDPTLYRKGSERLQMIKELAQGFQVFRRAALQFEKTRARIHAEETTTKETTRRRTRERLEEILRP